MGFSVEAIGLIQSCFKDKFGVPRQPGLIKSVNARLDFFPPHDGAEVSRQLDGVSHVWIIFVFHHCLGQQARLSVRPPRLGGNRKLGVFATRSTHRPNPIGLSVVELAGIEQGGQGISLLLRGADLVDGTPVLDMKPYVSMSDAIPGATADYATDAPQLRFEVVFSPQATQQCCEHAVRWPDLYGLIVSVLSQDPRPAYLAGSVGSRVYSVRLYDLDVHWSVADQASVEVHSINRVPAG